SVKQDQFLLHVGDRLGVTVSLMKMRTEQIQKKFVNGQIFSLTVDCDLFYGPWDYPAFQLHARMKVIVQAQMALCSLACLSVVTHTWMLVHALLQDFLFRTCMGVQPVSRRSIPLPPRLDPVVRNDF